MVDHRELVDSVDSASRNPQVSHIPSFFPRKSGGQTVSFFEFHLWVLNTVRGYQIEFVSLPVGNLNSNPLHFNYQDQRLIEKEVLDLSQKGAIVEVPWDSLVLLSNIFLVKKKSAGFRPVINVKNLNKFVKFQHFKMEGIHFLRDLLNVNDWFAKIDLKDAYLMVPIHTSHQKFLQFVKTANGNLLAFLSVWRLPRGVSPNC